jgi:hypothetical protein
MNSQLFFVFLVPIALEMSSLYIGRCFCSIITPLLVIIARIQQRCTECCTNPSAIPVSRVTRLIVKCASFNASLTVQLLPVCSAALSSLTAISPLAGCGPIGFPPLVCGNPAYDKIALSVGISAGIGDYYLPACPKYTSAPGGFSIHPGFKDSWPLASGQFVKMLV